MNSFVGWPSTEVVHPEKLACAATGLVSASSDPMSGDDRETNTGVGDLIKCFQRHGGVQRRNWDRGDNPLDTMHRDPSCPFLQPRDDVAVVPSYLRAQLLLSIGDSALQQCDCRDDQIVVQVPQTTLGSSSKEGKIHNDGGS